MCRHQAAGQKAERVYKSMKATGVRYLQFIPCLDPLDTPQGQQNYSLTPELYAQFLCAMFDAWYRDWKTSTYISIRLFEDYIHLLMGSPAGPAPRPVLAVPIWLWRVAVPCTRATSSAWMPINLELCKTTPCNRCLPARKCRHLSQTAGRSRRVPAVQMDPPVPRRLQARPQCYRHCAAQLLLQSPAKVFAYAEPRLCEMVRAVQIMYR